jgi:glycosyltransferase involved in cell wall biosynthesis
MLGRKLVVVGDGPDYRRLRRIAGPNVTFAGRVSDAEAARLLATSRALVMTGVEEFGIVSVEAQAAGRPVISVRGGGALETIQDGVTGTFWEGGPAQLAEAISGFDDGAVNPRACVDNAARFDQSVFREVLPREVERAVAAEVPPPVRHPTRRVRRGLARPFQTFD